MTKLALIINELKKVASEIKKLEAAADLSLYSQGDKSAYHSMLLRKAMLLVGLPERLAPHLKALDASQNKLINNQIGCFSFSAGKAVDIDSVFYMSALLYPEDYQAGACNDLENFIIRLESML